MFIDIFQIFVQSAMNQKSAGWWVVSSCCLLSMKPVGSSVEVWEIIVHLLRAHLYVGGSW